MDKQLKDKQVLLNKIAQLESVNDQLETELTYVNNLLYTVGFTKGICELKEAAEELLEDSE